MISKEEFDRLRLGNELPPLKYNEYYDLLYSKLRDYFQVNLQVVRKSNSSQGSFVQFRSPFSSPFTLGFIGTFAISINNFDPPTTSACVFISMDGHRLFPPKANQGSLDLNCEFGKDWTMDKWYMDEFDEFFPETWNWRPLPEDGTGTFSLKSMASQLGFQPNEIKGKPRKFPIWGHSGFALELEIVEEGDENVLCCKVFHGDVELVSQEGAFVKRIILGENI
jgi:hypothetical protein